MKYLVALFFCIPLIAAAQTPQVPGKLNFAGMTLHIHEDARKEIQNDVDMLTRYPKYFNIKVERAKTYFPVIEKIFAEERLPDDFKYLVLQESALIPDAVSVSNAVGFWQFKDFTAIEMGLRVDKEIDERMNIVASTRAAARYMKKNNFFFNNWLFALQAYQMGAGGVMRSVKDTHSGATKMDITSKTYWYVKKFLAHKIAFEGSTQGRGELTITFFENKEKQSSKELARTLAMGEEELLEYNKWIRKTGIPDDKIYAVTIPYINQNGGRDPLASLTATNKISNPAKDTHARITPSVSKNDKIKINGVVAVKVREGETMKEFADRNEISLSTLTKSNDISSNTKLLSGNYYFIKSKRSRAEKAYHKLEDGENLWSISQQYGVRIKNLLKYNRLKSPSEARPGLMLWLSSKKPKNQTGGEAPAEVIQVDMNESFAWAVDPQIVSETRSVATQKEISQEPKPALTDDTKPSPQKVMSEQEPMPEQQTNKDTVTTVLFTSAADSLVKGEMVSGIKNPDSAGEIKKDSLSTPSLEKETAQAKTHTVQSGETLYGIAKQYGIGVMDLAGWNNLQLQEGIHPGQVLVLHEKGISSSSVVHSAPTSPGNSNEVIHEVKGSDTLYSIARKYSVTIKDLMDWNGKKEFAISVGEKLKIQVPPNN